MILTYSLDFGLPSKIMKVIIECREPKILNEFLFNGKPRLKLNIIKYQDFSILFIIFAALFSCKELNSLQLIVIVILNLCQNT